MIRQRATYPLWTAACLFVLGLAWAKIALGESYFRVAPGPLNEGHAAYDHSGGCPECHQLGQGVTNQKCLNCHGAVAHKNGLHSTFGGQRCIGCHTEHKGRSHSIIDWNTVGGRDSFRHEITGFPRTHRHARVTCVQCHVRRLKTGRVSYQGLSRDCQSCHRNMHGLRRAELSQKCDTCHQPGQAPRGWTLRQWKAPHAKVSGVVLEGKHPDQPCTKCHEKAQLGGRAARRTCVDCHAPPHPVTEKTSQCLGCHAQSRPFRGTTVDHARFGLKLLGKHASVSCQRCHRRGGKPVAVSPGAQRTCGNCHVPVHPLAPITRDCAQCHRAGGRWRGATLDHRRVGFALLGHHTKLRCRRCHEPRTKLTYREGACTSCHQHRDAHRNQFADKPCATCHVEGGQRSQPFDHDRDTRFPLFGFHKQLQARSECERCHPGGTYRTGKSNCVDCHEDKHRGELGRQCSRCHTPVLRFDATRSRNFPHPWFRFQGKHRELACRACHTQGRYKIGKHTCYDCHKQDEPHQNRLGRDCGKCHVPAPGAPKFNHERMTRFPRTGAHLKAACSDCHQPPPARPSPLTLEEWKRLPVQRLDRTFPVRGTRCIDCHTDPHRGYVGTKCGQCHTAGSFREVSGARARVVKPLDHQGTWLRRHTVLPVNDHEPGAEGRQCAFCHGSPSCRQCHRTHAPRSHVGLWRLKTHGFAAAFDPSRCQNCHETWSCIQCHRRTAPLTHRGAWRTAHGFAAGGLGNDNCLVCHRRADCARCHARP